MQVCPQEYPGVSWASFLKDQPQQNIELFYRSMATEWAEWLEELKYLQTIDEYRFLKFFAIPEKSMLLGLAPNSLPPVWNPTDNELDGVIERCLERHQYFFRRSFELSLSWSQSSESSDAVARTARRRRGIGTAPEPAKLQLSITSLRQAMRRCLDVSTGDPGDTRNSSEALASYHQAILGIPSIMAVLRQDVMAPCALLFGTLTTDIMKIRSIEASGSIFIFGQ